MIKFAVEIWNEPCWYEWHGEVMTISSLDGFFMYSDSVVFWLKFQPFLKLPNIGCVGPDYDYWSLSVKQRNIFFVMLMLSYVEWE